LLFSVPIAHTSQRIGDDQGTEAQLLTLLMLVGAQPLFSREWRPGLRLAHAAFDRGHERSLLAAHKGACAELDFDVKIKTRAQDVLAQQATRLSLLQGLAKRLDGQGVLVADVDKAFVRPIA
jgi:hypothetical protein